MNAFSGKIWVIIYTLILLVQTGCTGIRPRDYSGGDNVGSRENIETLKSIIHEQGEKISSIEQDLEKYQDMMNDQSHVLDIYDDNNQNVIDFRKKLGKEVQIVLDNMQDGPFE